MESTRQNLNSSFGRRYGFYIVLFVISTLQNTNTARRPFKNVVRAACAIFRTNQFLRLPSVVLSNDIHQFDLSVSVFACK